MEPYQIPLPWPELPISPECDRRREIGPEQSWEEKEKERIGMAMERTE